MFAWECSEPRGIWRTDRLVVLGMLLSLIAIVWATRRHSFPVQYGLGSGMGKSLSACQFSDGVSRDTQASIRVRTIDEHRPLG